LCEFVHEGLAGSFFNADERGFARINADKAKMVDELLVIDSSPKA